MGRQGHGKGTAGKRSSTAHPPDDVLHRLAIDRRSAEGFGGKSGGSELGTQRASFVAQRASEPRHSQSPVQALLMKPPATPSTHYEKPGELDICILPPASHAAG
jgi:hypothetical protein